MHPARDELKGLVLGTLREDRADEITRHLDACPPCEETLANLDTTADSFIQAIKRPPEEMPFDNETDCHKLLDRVAALGRDASQGALQRADDPVAEVADLGDLGQYKLLAKLGEGGMGAVYKALHTRLEKLVAIKVLPTARMRDDHAVSRFEREMKAVGRLDHPHIVRAMDAGEHEGTHYLVMEYVEGFDLSQLSRQVGPLPVADACELVRQAALGLQAAHTRGMVHRDIKPSNLMLSTSEDGPPQVKVLDLGLALLADAHAPDNQGLTASGQVMGTLDYMAPEQGGDAHVVDIRADIYALGATLYKLLVGESVYHGQQYQTPIQKMMALATQPAPPIQSRRPDIPDELAATVHRMLEKDPNARFATPAEVAESLEPLAAGADLASLAQHAADSVGTPHDAMAVVTSPRMNSASAETASTVRKSVLTPGPSVSVRPGGGWRRPWSIAMAAGFAALLVFGGVLLSLRTPHGEVVIELGEDIPAEMAQDIKIEVAGNGQVKVADARAGWSIDVVEGKYQANLAGGDDRFQLDQQQVTVTRGKRTLLRVALKSVDELAAEARGVEPVRAEPAVAMPKAKLASPTQKWKPTKEQQEFMDAVAALPAEQQVEAVAARLKEVNPGSDGTLRGHRIDRNKMTMVIMHEMKGITDLSPLAALSLNELKCRPTDVADLSPLAGMPLKSLNLEQSSVKDLSPLAGMPLTSLYVGGTRVTDLSPLAGMPLTSLTLSNTYVTDLSPLAGMPLTSLTLSKYVTDLSPLAGMPLTNLVIKSTSVTDLSPLAGMPLISLNLEQSSVKDLSPLAGMPLTTLYVGGTRVTDLSPLAGMPLTSLSLSSTHVTDLSPLAGMPLTSLRLSRTRVADLSPLVGMPLELIELNVRLYHPADEAILRSLPLKQINGPAEQFWKEFELQREAAETFAAETAKLPAEEQVTAVVAQLKQLNGGNVGALGKVIDNDAVSNVNLVLRSEPVDVAPLRAFSQLKRLQLIGGPPWQDLSPVNSLPLEELTCTEDIALRNAPVLRDMPTLTTINGQPAADYLRQLEQTSIPSADK